MSVRRCAALALAAMVPMVASTVAPTAMTGVAGASTRYLDPMFQVDIAHDVVYGHATAADGAPVLLQLDLYTPRGDVVVDRPAVLLAHGGFFVAGSRTMSE